MDFGLALMKLLPDVPPSDYELMMQQDGSVKITRWFSSVSKPSEQEVIDYWNNVVAPQKAADELEALRSSKQAELESYCAADLKYGYQYIVNGVQYRFSFDTEAQLNFQGGKPLLESGAVPFIPWTAYDPTGKRTRLNLTLADLQGMELAQFHHKSDVTSKYNDLLLNHLYPAQTADDINAVTWGAMI